MKLTLPFSWTLQGAAIALCIITLVVSVESKSAVFAYESQPDHLSGLQFAAITLLGAALAALGFNIIGQMKNDPRREVRNRVWQIRALAVTFMAFPVWFFGCSMKLPNEQKAWDAYHASERHPIDVEIARQAAFSVYDERRTASDVEISEAQGRIIRPTGASLDPFSDAEFWFALILIGVLNLAAEKFRLPPPETDEERLARLTRQMTPEQLTHFNRSEGGKRGAQTRKRNRQLEHSGAVPISRGRRKKTA